MDGLDAPRIIEASRAPNLCFFGRRRGASTIQFGKPVIFADFVQALAFLQLQYCVTSYHQLLRKPWMRLQEW